MPTITKTVSTEVEVEVDIDVEDEELLQSLDDEDLIEEAESRGLMLVDRKSYTGNALLISRAIAFVRAMPDRPRILEDFFYRVHGEAM